MKKIWQLRLSGNRRTWERLGRSDPLWAVLSDPAKRHGGWDEAGFFATGESDVENSLGILKELGVELKFGTALDFGCGVGRLTRALSGRFDKVLGLDVSASMIDEARRRNSDRPNIEFRVNTGETIPTITAGAIDFAYSRLVLQHVPTVIAARYVSELVRVLSEGGIAMFSAPYADPRWDVARLRSAVRAIRELLPGQNRMSVYPLPVPMVEIAVARAGGSIKAALPDPHPPGWRGVLYVVEKLPQARIGRRSPRAGCHVSSSGPPVKNP